MLSQNGSISIGTSKMIKLKDKKASQVDQREHEKIKRVTKSTIVPKKKKIVKKKAKISMYFI